jgi:hypothetical protein
VRVKGATPDGASRRAEPARSFDSAIARLRKERGLRRGEEPEPSRRRDPAGRSRDAEAGPSGSRTTSVPGQSSSCAPCVPGSPTANPGRLGGEPALPELREAARAIPPAIWAGRLEGVPSVELAFGRDLSVELRQGSAGIELAVRTGPPLARAARVDLPALVQSLRARGVIVARAEVRGGSPGPGVASR